MIRHLIGIPAGILRMDFRWYSAATLGGSLVWTSVLAWLGTTVGRHPELLQGSLEQFITSPVLEDRAGITGAILLAQSGTPSNHATAQ